MRIRILGSGCWEGVPAPFSRNQVDKRAWERKDKNFRCRPQLQVTHEERSFLVEISPDIRIISQAFDLEGQDTFIVSHHHHDHLGGLMDLAAYTEQRRITIYCPPQTRRHIDEQHEHIKNKEVIALKNDETTVIKGVSVTPLPVEHGCQTYGYLFEAQGQKIAYLSDYSAIPKKTLSLIEDADIIIADGTYLFDETIPEHHYIRNRDPGHLHGKDITKQLEGTRGKVVFINISSMTGLPHEELQRRLPQGMLIGYDGMRLPEDLR